MRPVKPIAWRRRDTAAMRAARMRRYFDVPRLVADERNPYRPDMLSGVDIFAPERKISLSEQPRPPRLEP